MAIKSVASTATNKRRQEHNRRQFKVGIVGATEPVFSRIVRIFEVTQCRARHYQPVYIPHDQFTRAREVDLVVMCSLNPLILAGWEKHLDRAATSSRPMIYLSHPAKPIKASYQLVAPVNPAKLIKLIDHYTIQELDFFPEFEIGNESGEVHNLTASGLQMLRSANKSKSVDYSQAVSRALVVDDSLAVRRQMQIEFELQNARLDVAETAEEAMTAIAKHKYDIIFLDVVMPGMDGYTACKKIKRSPLNRQTPVVLLTSRSGSFDKIKGTLAGCDSYLVKPLNHNEFTAVYQQYLGAAVAADRAGDRAHVSK